MQTQYFMLDGEWVPFKDTQQDSPTKCLATHVLLPKSFSGDKKLTKQAIADDINANGKKIDSTTSKRPIRV